MTRAALEAFAFSLEEDAKSVRKEMQRYAGAFDDNRAYGTTADILESIARAARVAAALL